ncbi:hypothetical protein BpHYR1_029033 [Brachionus plicatilis]|uniref:Uncharacterized protein n=1 Tax=Brachionus plicatilis TaxID=10195 RepID=A0A3M7SWF8_BRAPC|nr:hypothetical protein BpHYR1_029033 [Brachionus plicatilis]
MKPPIIYFFLNLDLKFALKSSKYPSSTAPMFKPLSSCPIVNLKSEEKIISYIEKNKIENK